MKNLNEMSLYVRRAFDHTMPLNWALPKRIIYDYEILYVKDGQLKVNLEKETLYGKHGDVFLFKPRQVHSLESFGNVPLRQPHVHFDFYYDDKSPFIDIPLCQKKEYVEENFREDIVSSGTLYIPTKTSLKNPLIFENLLSMLIMEQVSLNPLAILAKKSILFKMIYILLQENRRDISRTSNAERLVKIANDFIAENSNRNITEDEIAVQVGYSKNYFIWMYKNYLGISPKQYHQQIRIENAKNLLVTTKMSITEAALELGFEDVFSFSRFFKRIVKISPEQYRQSLAE